MAKILKLKGFTLVELIIVIVIIGILAAISIIGYSSQAVRARDSSAFVGLTEAVKAANVCIANGDTLTVTDKTHLIAGNGGQLCTAGVSTTPAVVGAWPNISAIGGNWKYIDYSATALPTGAPTGGVANSVTADSVALATANVATATTTTVASGDHGVSCTINGCTKYNF